MKTLYLECKMGAAGDMLMGALLELIPDREEFLGKLNSLGLPGVAVGCETAVRCGITGSHIHVTIDGAQERAHDHEHGHNHGLAHEQHYHEHTSHDREHDAHECTRRRNREEDAQENPLACRADEDAHECTRRHSGEHSDDCGHALVCHDQGHPYDHDHGDQAHVHEHGHFSYADIQSLIGTLPLSDKVKSDALAVYRLIGDAESAVHGVPVEQIHFHEVGSLDAVADVIGCCLLFELIGAEEIVASPVCTGSGTVRCAHGILPVPAPATARLLLGIPCYSGDIQSELCTPTGAALLRHFAARFCGMPPMTIERIGCGMGAKDFPVANCVRAFLGEAFVEAAPQGGAEVSEVLSATDTDSGTADTIYELCCNLDDMTPEAVGYACELLLREGALDIFTTPIQMKKFRPAVLLTCLCRPDEKEKLTQLMLRHTTTLGVRFRRCERSVLRSRQIVRETEYGKIRVKLSEGHGICKSKAEYEDVKAASERCGVPFATVIEAASAGINCDD